MTLLLDADQVPRAERAEALQDVFRSESPQRVVVLTDPELHRRRIEVVDLGGSAHLIRNVGSGLQITRDARHVSLGAPEALVIGLQRTGTSLISVGEVQTEHAAGGLGCVDITRSYRYVDRGHSDHHSFIVSNQQVGVSVDVVRRAALHLAASPVYDLVRRHAAHLFDATRDLREAPRLLTGQATVALVRALLTTAAEARSGRDALEETLDLRIVLYLDAHAADQALDPERVAAAHHLSLRHLYTVWARAGHDRSLAQEIIHRRLERARAHLSSDNHASIEAVAHGCGFRNVSHFIRRFRETYGVSPAQWRTSDSEPAVTVDSRSG